MKKKNRWNPRGLPSPASFGFVKGARVMQVHGTDVYFGRVTRVYPNCVVITEDGGMVAQCHPVGRYTLIEPATETFLKEPAERSNA